MLTTYRLYARGGGLAYDIGAVPIFHVCDGPHSVQCKY